MPWGSTLLAMPCGMALCLSTLAVAAVSGVKQAEQGLAAGLQGTAGQAGGGLFLALTATVITASTNGARGPARGPVQGWWCSSPDCIPGCW